MRKLMTLTLIAALPASAEEASSPLSQILADAAKGPVYAYDMTF